MRANSEDGILTMAWYSASGIPRCSLSMSISFISKSAILSWSVSFIYLSINGSSKKTKIFIYSLMVVPTSKREGKGREGKTKDKEKGNQNKRSYRTGGLKHEGDRVSAVVGLDGDDVVIASAAQHLGHVGKVHAHGEVTVAAVVLEALGAEQEGDEGDVAGVHGLEGEAGGGAVEVGVVHQLAHGVHNLLQEAALNKPQLQHLCSLLLLFSRSPRRSLYLSLSLARCPETQREIQGRGCMYDVSYS
jgi:hypothetical protein